MWQDVEAQCRVGEQLQRSHQYSAAATAYRGAVDAAEKSKGADFLATAHDGLAVALASLKDYEVGRMGSGWEGTVDVLSCHGVEY